MFALALVLLALGVLVGVTGALAATHRLPRNRVVGVRTPWTLSRVDTFRRANRAAAPAMLAAGGVGVVAGLGVLLRPGGTGTAVMLLVVGTLGLLGLLGTAGLVGTRYASADEAAEAAESAPAGPCTLDAEAADDTGSTDDTERADAACAGETACAGSCALCPRAGAQSR